MNDSTLLSLPDSGQLTYGIYSTALTRAGSRMTPEFPKMPQTNAMFWLLWGIGGTLIYLLLAGKFFFPFQKLFLIFQHKSVESHQINTYIIITILHRFIKLTYYLGQDFFLGAGQKSCRSNIR